MSADNTEMIHWAATAQKYFVHPETEAGSKRSAEQGHQKVYVLGLEASRQQFREIYHKETQYCREVTGYTGSIKNMVIPSSHVREGVPVIVYTPEALPDVPVIVIYFHGGGLVICDAKVSEICMMNLAQNAPAIVVIVDHRNLPCEQDRLAPFNDCEAVARWVLDNKSAIGGVASSPVGVVGDSAGGQLCCSMSYSLPGRFAFQVLVYPVADIVLDGFQSMKDFWDTPGFCGKDMEVMFKWCRLFEEPSFADDPRVNPSAKRGAGDSESDPPLSASPPTLVLLAALDPLKDWGREYAHKLLEAGVRVQLREVKGFPHIFFTDMQQFPTGFAQGHKIVAEFIRLFQPGRM